MQTRSIPCLGETIKVVDRLSMVSMVLLKKINEEKRKLSDGENFLEEEDTIRIRVYAG
jgi:hypothetical protein